MSEIGKTFEMLSRWLGGERGPQAAREILRRLIATNPALAREIVTGELAPGDAGRIGPTVAAELVRALLSVSRPQAEEIWRRAAQVWPNDPDVTSAGAALWLAGEDWAKALAMADEALRQRPRHVESLRVAAEALVEHKEAGTALERYAELLRAEASTDTLNAVVAGLDRIDEIAGPSPELPRYWSAARVAVAGNVTTNYLVSHVRALALLEKIHAQVWAGGFDQYRQEILDAGSELYAFKPKVLLIVLDWRELVPALYGASLATDPAAVRAEIDREVAELANLLSNFRQHSSANVLVTGPVPLGHTPLGFLDEGHGRGLAGHAAYLEGRLVEALRPIDGVYVQQTGRVLGWGGLGQSLSEKMRYLARMPYAPAGLRALAADLASFVRQALGKAKKCLVLDLDNTLWGGIIGEDGLEGIKLGPDGVGRAFLDFQREILRLMQQGTILAICSKNNETDVQEVFEKHPHMLLKNEHFAGLRINWVDKPTNLRELAEEISIGLDAMVFLDDNPVERDAVRQLVPEVFVPDLPADPVDYPGFLRALGCFQSLQLTEEDMQRGRFYADDRRRKELREQAGGLEGYLTALGMVVNIRPLDEFTQPRVVQLINRTNQFNLTTRRYSEVDIGQMIAGGDAHVFSLQLEDRYGDNGIVGVAILKLMPSGGERVALIDSLLMSCRILGRNVERVFLGFLCDFAAERGAAGVIGEFIPTAKNKQVAEFYPRNGFESLPAEGTTQRWRRSTAQRFERPAYMDVRTAATGGAGAPDGR